MIAVGRFDSTFEMTVPDDAVDTQNASEPLDSDANASLTHERVHLTVPGGVKAQLLTCGNSEAVAISMADF